MNYGKAIKRLRHLQDLSQKELADKTGMSASTISLMENGVNQPSLVNLTKIGKVLKCELSEIIKLAETI